MAEAIAADDGVFYWLLNCLKLPTLNLTTIHIIVMLTARITAITTSPITDASSLMPNEVCVVGMLVGIFEALVTVVVTICIAVTIDVVSVIPCCVIAFFYEIIKCSCMV